MFTVAYTELGLLCCFIIWFIQHHSTKEVSLSVKFIVFVDWFLSFGMILLLPVDVYLKIFSEKEGIAQDDIPEFTALKIARGIMFWLVMGLCWIVIPIMEDYQACGFLDHERKWQYSIRKNSQFFGIVGGLTIVVVIILESTDTMNGYGLVTFLKSLANCWGIFQIMILLGYSLVTIPRSHFRTTDDKLQMKYLAFRAAQIKKEQEESLFDLLENLKQIVMIRKVEKYSKDILFYCENIIHLVPAEIIELVSEKKKKSIDEEQGKQEKDGQGKEDEDIQDQKDTEEKKEDTNEKQKEKKKVDKELNNSVGIHYTFDSVVELRKQVKQNWAEVRRARSNWKELLKKAFWLQDIIKSENNDASNVIESSLRKPRIGFQANLRNKIEWYWFVTGKKQIKAIWSIFLSAMSIIVLVSEVSLFWDSDYSILGWFVNLLLGFELSVFGVQVVTLLPLLFMIFNVYYGLFRLKISGFFGLYPNHHTDAASLLFASINFSRVAAPLCYNYLEMIQVHDSAFNRVMGNINIVPVLGSDFTNFFPSMLIIFCFFNLFDLYGKILSLFGLEQFQFTDTYNSSLIEEGTALIQKARFEEEQKLQLASGSHGQELEDRQSYLARIIEEHDV